MGLSLGFNLASAVVTVIGIILYVFQLLEYSQVNYEYDIHKHMAKVSRNAQKSPMEINNHFYFPADPECAAPSLQPALFAVCWLGIREPPKD